MAIVQIYSHPHTQTFRSSLCSKATLFGLFSLLLAVLPPFFVAYSGRSFWLKEDFYLETPRVHFLHQVLAILHSADDARTFSTYDNFNQLHSDSLVPTAVSVDEEATETTVRLAFSTGSDFSVRSISLILLFRYELDDFVELTLEGMAFAQQSTAVASSGLYFDGELRLKQNFPVSHSGRDATFNVSVVDINSIDLENWALSRLMKRYKDRDLRLELTSADYVWTPKTVNDGFVVEGRLRFPEQRVAYRPGLAQLLKWAWIQYVSILAIFAFIVERIRAFVFLNQVIPTIVESRIKKFKRG